MPKPILLVALGPTGSGKSSLPDKVKIYLSDRTDLDLNLEATFTEVLVDNLVEKSLKYKVEVF